jgi:hypothetical protein
MYVVKIISHPNIDISRLKIINGYQVSIHSHRYCLNLQLKNKGYDLSDQ